MFFFVRRCSYLCKSDVIGFNLWSLSKYYKDWSAFLSVVACVTLIWKILCSFNVFFLWKNSTSILSFNPWQFQTTLVIKFEVIHIVWLLSLCIQSAIENLTQVRSHSEYFDKQTSSYNPSKNLYSYNVKESHIHMVCESLSPTELCPTTVCGCRLTTHNFF